MVGEAVVEAQVVGPAPRLRDGVRAAAPLALGPVLFGVSFGLLAAEAGMGVVAAVAFSATTFAGSAQFASASLLDEGGTVAAAIVTGALLNARYVPMSVAVASIFPGRAWRRLLQAQLIVDESWALSGRSGRFDRNLLVGAGLTLYVLWTASTAAGVLLGDRLGDPADFGLDAAFATLFLGLGLPYLRQRRALEAAVLGVVAVLVLLPVAPAGLPIVVASAACLLGLRR